MRRFCLPLLLLLLFGAHDSLAAASPNGDAASRFDVRRGHVFALYYLLRKHATAETNPASEIEGFGEAVNAARQLQSDFGGRFSPVWGLLDEYLSKCRNTSEVVRSFAELPLTTNFRGKDYPVRANAIRFAKAMHAVEAQFLKATWPQHRATREAALEQIVREVALKTKETPAGN
jgi:hypothetical protein